MAAALARREDDLRGHADVLEARVAERTQELLVTNNRLQVEIAERQSTEAALVQSQKLQVVGQLAGGIAHDFNNLLATIQGSLDLLSRTLPPKEERQRTWIERATGAVNRGSQLTGRLLAFSRRQRLAVQASDVNKLMSDLVPLLRICTHGQRIRIDTWLGDDLWPAMVEPSQVEAAILNLALNARDAMPDGGVLTITTANQPVADAMNDDVAAGDYVAIIVTDTGVGMTDEVVRRAFEPFFTTKGLSGSGLGLSQVQGMVRESGGTVRLTTSSDGGTSVTLLLPRAAEMPKPDRPRVRAAPRAVTRERAGRGRRSRRAGGERGHAAPAWLSRDHGGERPGGDGGARGTAGDRGAGPCHACDDWAGGRGGDAGPRVRRSDYPGDRLCRTG